MKHLKYFISFFYTTIIVVMSAQSDNNLKLYPGPDVILFSVGNEAVHPQGSITGYIIERQKDSEQLFRKVAELNYVPDYLTFQKNIQKFLKHFPHIDPDPGVNAEALFQHVKHGNSLSELGSSGKQILIKAGFGLMWWDDDVTENRKYRYRVLNHKAEVLSQSDWLSFSKQNKISQPFYLFNNYHQLINRLSIHLGVIHPYHIHKVEVKRTHLGDKSEEIKTINIIHNIADTSKVTITDTSLMANRIYEYNFRLTDLPGNVSEWSKALTQVSFDYLQMPLPHKISTASDTVKGGVKIKWVLDQAELLSKLELFRSNNSVNEFERVATLYPGIMEYTDTELTSSQSYFYYFEGTYKMFDTPKRGITFSAYFSDGQKPLPPEMIGLDSDESGIRVRWSMADRNILGFRVYRAMDDEAFILVSDMIPYDIQNSEYMHTDADDRLKGNKFYKYAVKTIANNLTESDMSETLITRPLFNIPVPNRPLRPEVILDEGRVIIFWNVDVEQDPELLTYRIIRENNDLLAMKDTFYTEVNMLIDSTAAVNIDYKYTISAISIFDQLSPESESVTAKLERQKPVSPSSLSSATLSDGIKFWWELPSGGEKFRYNLYRYERGEVPQIVASTAFGQDNITIKNAAKSGNLYFYFVKSEDITGNEGESSNEVSVRW